MMWWIAQAETAVNHGDGVLSTIEIGVLTGMCVAGLLVMLLGRRLVRVACAAAGVVLGTVGAWICMGIFPVLSDYWIAVLIVGAILGGVLAGILFKIWVASASAVVLAAVVPLGTLAWQSGSLDELPPPEAQETAEQTEDQGSDLDPSMTSSLTGISQEDVEKLAEQAQVVLDQVGTDVQTLLRSWAQARKHEATAWWDSLEPTTRRSLWVGAGVGAVLGVLLGVAIPLTTASILCALSGSMLIVIAGRTLALGLGGESIAGYVPESPRAMVLVIGLITMLGVVIQWTLRSRKDDE